MFIGRLERDKDWNFGLEYRRDWERYNRFDRVLKIWLFRLKEFPEPGETIHPGIIQGYFWEWHFKIPFSLEINRYD